MLVAVFLLLLSHQTHGESLRRTRTYGSRPLLRKLNSAVGGMFNRMGSKFDRSRPSEGRRGLKSKTNSLVFTDDLEMQLKRLLSERRAALERRSGGRKSVPAIAFDIDGVFKMGGQYTSEGAKTLRKIKAAGIPYVLMTNGGGGRTEDEYATEMNKKLHAFDKDGGTHEDYVQEDAMILSYTPFASDLAHLKDEPVLCVGSPRVIDAVNHYGFNKAMHLSEYTCKHPLMNPFGESGCEKDDCVINPMRESWDEDFKAILVFTDPENFFEGIQVLTDVLLSSKPGEVEYEPGRRIPIVFSNPDLLWKTQYPHARFGQGAFRLSLEACYKARMESLGVPQDEIENRLGDFVQYGKPEVSQFLHTKRSLLKQASDLGVDISHYYMVGDNPASDIQGAKNMDARAIEKQETRWSGLLVRTGVYKDGDDHLDADLICDGVADAVDHVISKHAEELKNNLDQSNAVNL